MFPKARPASRGAHGRRTRLTRTRDTTGTAGCADLRAVEHTDGAHGSRGGRTRDTTGTAGCGSVSRSFSACVKQSSISHHTFLVSLKGSVSPMRETPRATGSIASDCFSETLVAQRRLIASQRNRRASPDWLLEWLFLLVRTTALRRAMLHTDGRHIPTRRACVDDLGT